MIRPSKKGSAIAGLLLGMCTATALAQSPQDFLHNAIRSDRSEIMLGRLAEQRAAAPDVQKFGHTLVMDHGQALNQAIDVAHRIGTDVPQRPLKEAMNEHNRLQRMNGQDFDREFVRYMISDHKRDIKEFRNEARNDHGPVGRMARDQLPTLRKHLDIATNLRANENRYSQR